MSLNMFSDMHHSKADFFSTHPFENMSDEELEKHLRENGSEMSVAEVRALLTTPTLSATCPLCGRSFPYLADCKGCAGEQWGRDFLEFYGEDAPARARQGLIEALSKVVIFSQERIEAAANHAYRNGGCHVCKDCFHAALENRRLHNCPLLMLQETVFGESHRAFEDMVKRLSEEELERDFPAEFMRIVAYWTDHWNPATESEQRAKVDDWRSLLILAAFKITPNETVFTPSSTPEV